VRHVITQRVRGDLYASSADAPSTASATSGPRLRRDDQPFEVRRAAAPDACRALDENFSGLVAERQRACGGL